MFALAVFASCAMVVLGEPLLLTPLINSGKIDEAKKQAKIKGEIEGLGYSGYFTVNATNSTQQNNIFTWFQPCSEGCDDNAPFILWMQGGPGGPGVFGALSEVGSFYVKKDMTLGKRCYSWCKTANCLFVDQPVGTGFSFQSNPDGKFTPIKDIVYTTTSKDATEQVHGVLSQVFTMFPQYQKSPFYITGESYGGLYEAHMGKTIVEHNAVDKTKINFVGLAVGDPILNSHYQWKTYGATLYALGLVFGSERDNIDTMMNEGIDLLDSNCPAAFAKWNATWDDNRGGNHGLFHKYSGSGMTENALMSAPPPEFDRWNMYTMAHQEVFHIKGAPLSSGAEGGPVYAAMVNSGDICSNSSDIYADLHFNHDIDLMIYTTNMDPLLGVPCTEAGVEAFWDYAESNLKQGAAKTAYYATEKDVWHVADNDTDVAGYARCTYDSDNKKRFCFTVVRNGGHELPAFQPRSSMDMWVRFIENRSFAPKANDPSRLPSCVPCAGAGPFAGDVLGEDCIGNGGGNDEPSKISSAGYIGIGCGIGAVAGGLLAVIFMTCCGKKRFGNLQDIPDGYNQIDA